MELEIDDLALFRELLALAAVAVAEDVLEPVFGTCFVVWRSTPRALPPVTLWRGGGRLPAIDARRQYS